MLCSHLILCHPLLLLPPIPPSIRVLSSESTLRMRWPQYWSFSLSISPSNEHPGLISFRMDWLALLAVQGTLKSLLQHHSSEASILRSSAFFTVQLSHPYLPTGKTIALTRQTFVGKVISLLFNMLSRLVITFLPRSKCPDTIFLIYIFLNFLNFIIVIFVQSLSTTLCDPMDCSTPGFPVLHHLPEFAQTRVYWVGNAIQPSHPLLSPSPPTLNLSLHQGFFQWVGSSHQVAESIGASASASVLPMNIQDWFPLSWLVWSCSPKDSQKSSPTPQFKSINSSELSFIVQLLYAYMTTGKP